MFNVTHVSILLSNDFSKTFVLPTLSDWFPNYHNKILLYIISEARFSFKHCENSQNLSHGYDCRRFLKDFFYQEYPPLIKTYFGFYPKHLQIPFFTLNAFKILNWCTGLLPFRLWAFSFTVWHTNSIFSYFFHLKQNF